MANVSLTVTVKRAWWVPIYFGAIFFLVWIAARIIRLDEDKIARFIDRQVAFISTNGFSFFCDGKQV